MIQGIRFSALVIGATAVFFLAIAVIAGFERPSVLTLQRGYRGVGMEENFNPRILARTIAANQAPVALPAQDLSGQPSSAVYQNVQVLKDLDASEFLRLMAAITEWVSPQQGCAYCHDTNDLASDAPYQKVVSRRMLQMVQQINTTWKSHTAVAGVGVTCYTCHRGQPVPSQIWFNDPGPKLPGGVVFNGRNEVSPAAGYTALVSDPFTPFLEQANNIRVNGPTALPTGNLSTIKQTYWSYGLMMQFSQALGVNCTYCHNSRQFSSWEESPPQRVTAWYGIRMVRDLNNNYLTPLKPTLPPARLGPLGDAPKVSCATCHQGVYKPLFGAAMLKDYPELATGK